MLPLDVSHRHGVVETPALRLYNSYMGTITGKLARASFFVLVCAATVTHAQRDPGPLPAGYPSKPIRILVGSSAGGGVDHTIRLAAHKLTDRLGRQVIVENRDGASGAIAMDIAAKATPDGYTLYAGGNTMILVGAQKKVPFDIRTAYSPIVRMTSQPYLLLITPSLPVSSVKELIAYAKSRPAALSYGTAGTGSATNLGTELLKFMTGMDIVHVPYKGNAQALVDLTGGQIHVMFASGIAAGPHIKSGRVKTLAVASPRRMQAYPDLPTVSEAGVPGFELVNSFGLYAPAGTSPAILLVLNREVSQFMNSPEMKEKLALEVTEAAPPGSPAEFKAAFVSEVDKWEKFLKSASIKLN